jgi:hypothetical protein
VETRGRTYEDNYTYTARMEGTLDIPLILLIDENSASASEIVAGAIRDHRRGTIVGRKSYGKWSVQTIYDLRTGGGVRLTTAKFYSPRGDTLGKIGVKPDVPVDANKDDVRHMGEVDPINDADVRTAIELLRGSNSVTQRWNLIAIRRGELQSRRSADGMGRHHAVRHPRIVSLIPMSSTASREFGLPAWIRAGRGRMPALGWSFTCDGPLTALACARESGELFVADATRHLTRLDARGELASLTRFPAPVRLLAVSDDGQWGAAVVDDGTVFRFDRGLGFVWELTLPEPCLAIALSPFGFHLAAAMADGHTEIFNERKRRMARFETVRPLAYLQFCTQSPVLYGAAEHGLVGCYDLQGGELWQERSWSNVGDLCVTGDGDLVYLAGSTHGIQTLDGDGGTVGAYVLEGTVRQVACSYEPYRLAASTVERQLYWINSEGEVLWVAETPADVVELACDAFGTAMFCGMDDGAIVRLDWGGV